MKAITVEASLSFSWKYSSEEPAFFKREMLSFFSTNIA